MYIKNAATSNMGVEVCTGEHAGGLQVGALMYIKDAATDYV